jgi:hypothetical protein
MAGVGIGAGTTKGSLCLYQLFRFRGIETGIFLFLRLVLNESHESAIRVYQSSDAAAPRFDLRRMQTRLSLASFWQPCGFTDGIKGVEIVQPQTATEPTGRRIQSGMPKELQGEITALQNHPAFVAPRFGEAESCVELRGFLEVP